MRATAASGCLPGLGRGEGSGPYVEGLVLAKCFHNDFRTHPVDGVMSQQHVSDQPLQIADIAHPDFQQVIKITGNCMGLGNARRT